jgi:pyrroline-5-carboxylate reductase
MKLALIGGGIMGEAILAGVLGRGLTAPGDITVCELIPERRQYLAERHHVSATEDAAEAVKGAEIVVLAVKPQEFAGVGKALAGRLAAGQTLMSIMAGVTIAGIQSATGHPAIVRSIPNTPAQIGEGVTVWTAAGAVPEPACDAVRQVLSVLGREIYVDDERYVDMATAVSSSGPAYVFLVIEAMIDAAVHIGLRRDMATRMVLQTVLGSARYAESAGKHPAELRNQVTSPGGTTAEGLLALEEAGLRAAFVEAIEAAYEKARRLGG